MDPSNLLGEAIRRLSIKAEEMRETYPVVDEEIIEFILSIFTRELLLLIVGPGGGSRDWVIICFWELKSFSLILLSLFLRLTGWANFGFIEQNCEEHEKGSHDENFVGF